MLYENRLSGVKNDMSPLQARLVFMSLFLMFGLPMVALHTQKLLDGNTAVRTPIALGFGIILAGLLIQRRLENGMWLPRRLQCS